MAKTSAMVSKQMTRKLGRHCERSGLSQCGLIEAPTGSEKEEEHEEEGAAT